jgi:hypothetical protein
MARSTLDIIIQLVKKGGGDKDAVRGLLDIKRAWTSIMGAVAGVTAAYAIVDKVIVQNVNRFADYALKMDDMSRVTGIQVDQMSRLVQAADDLRISQETLNTGLEFAIRQGYEPSVEWLGQMADQIRMLPPGAQRAEEAIRLFGKASGPDMLRLLEQGSTGIEQYMSGVEDGLVVTQEGVQAAREWHQSVDRMTDAWDSFLMGLGQDFVGPAADVLNWLVEMNEQVDETNKSWTRFLPIPPLLRYAIMGVSAAEEVAAEKTEENTRTLTDWARGMYEAQQTGFEFGTAVQDTSQQMQEFGSIAKQSVEDVSISMYQLALAQDGVFDEADMQRLLDYQVALGTMTELERAAAEQALALNSYLSTLPADIPINIRITITRAMGYGATRQEAQWLASNPALAGLPGLAEGGPLGMANIVGERGWEAIVERQDGEHVVIPHEMSQFLMDQGLLPVAGMYGGGGPIGGGITKGSKRALVNSLTKSGSVSVKGWSSASSTTVWKPDPVDPSGSGGVTAISSASGQAAAAAAVEAVAPLVQDTMNTFSSSTQQNAWQVSQQTAVVERTSEAQLGEIRAMRRDIQALAEQLAAEIKKG